MTSLTLAISFCAAMTMAATFAVEEDESNCLPFGATYVLPLNLPRASVTLSPEGATHPVLEPSIGVDFQE